MKLGVRGKLFALSFGLILVTLGIAYGYSRRALARAADSEVRRDLVQRARLVASAAERLADATPERWERDAEAFARAADARVTLIADDGRVLADSGVPFDHLDAVENHRARPEVAAALAGGVGESVRRSATVDVDLLYVAVPFQAGSVHGVARVALPLTHVERVVGGFDRAVLLAALFALLVAAVMSTVASRMLGEPLRAMTDVARLLTAGDLTARTRAQGDDEVGELGRALDSLASALSTKLVELETEHARLAGILSGMREGVLVVDASDRVLLVNPAFREMLLLGDDALGKPLLAAARHADLDRVVSEARTSEAPVQREIEIGGLKPRRLLVRASRSPSGDAGVLVVVFDVTEMRRLESLRRDFVANVSHELRTPITAIQSAAETLEVALDDPAAARQFAQMIARNSERLRALVEDLLELSRIESQKLRLDLTSVPLAPVVDHVFGLFGERARARGQSLVNDGLAALPDVHADRFALERVLTNLVENAVKYGGSGSTLRVHGKVRDGRLRVCVSDTGPGIEERHLARLFERFYRVDPGRSRDQGGTGLGLSIVRHLVESMAGEIGVESQIGKGTTFWFELPAAS